MTKRLGMGSQHWQDYRAREEQRKQEELAALNWATPGSEGWDMSGKTALSNPFLDILPTRAITAPLAIAASVVKPIVKQATKKYRTNKVFSAISI